MMPSGQASLDTNIHKEKGKKITLTPLYIFSYNLSRSSGLANHYINMWKLATEENLGQMHFSNLSQV